MDRITRIAIGQRVFVVGTQKVGNELGWSSRLRTQSYDRNLLD